MSDAEDVTSATGRRISVVGPTHPTKGGISQHTDALIDELMAAGADCTIETWAAQYPKRLYPGQQNVAAGSSQRTARPQTHRSLRWFDPTSWIRAGLRARRADTIVLALVVPFQVVALAIVVAVGRIGRSDTSVVVVAHNVLPHEGLPFDRLLVKFLIRISDRVIAHTDEQGALARALGADDVAVEAIPPFFSPEGRRNRVGEPASRHVAFFGLVRDYKGVDTLIRALPSVPEIRSSVHGEFWVDEAELLDLAQGLGVADRVELDNRYIADEDVPDILDTIDALVLPYRSGTASAFVLIAHRLGIPVVATEVGSFPDQVDHDANGILCPPDDPAALAAALAKLYVPGTLDHLRQGAFDSEPPERLWDPYIAAVCNQ